MIAKIHSVISDINLMFFEQDKYLSFFGPYSVSLSVYMRTMLFQ